MKIIGIRKLNIKYSKRPGAYAIIERDEDRKIAIVTDGDYFFLGGGIEEGETEIDALKRELIEESGYTIKNLKFFDRIASFIDGTKRGPLEIVATVYLAKFDKKVAKPIEKDHEILWINPEEYVDKLHREYQRYILSEYVYKRDEKNEE